MGLGDRTARLIDLRSGRFERVFEGHTFIVSCAVFVGGQRHVLTASFDRTLKLWDTGSGAERASLRGHTNNVTCCAAFGLCCLWGPSSKWQLGRHRSELVAAWGLLERKGVQCAVWFRSLM